MGRTVTYAYDARNEHLLSVTDFDGTVTTYTYDTGSAPATANALVSITNPDATHIDYAYDAQGRLDDVHRDGSAEDVTYSYGGPGGPGRRGGHRRDRGHIHVFLRSLRAASSSKPTINWTARSRSATTTVST